MSKSVSSGEKAPVNAKVAAKYFLQSEFGCIAPSSLCALKLYYSLGTNDPI